MPTVRLARPQDLPAIWALVQRTISHMLSIGNPQWGEDYPTYQHFVQDIQAGELYVVAGPAGEIWGAAAITQTDEPEYAQLTWSRPSPAVALHRVAVDPQVQRQGVASALFAQAHAVAEAKGCASLRIDTYTLNHRMQSLIAKQGFHHVGDIQYPNRPLPTLCYEKVLSFSPSLGNTTA